MNDNNFANDLIYILLCYIPIVVWVGIMIYIKTGKTGIPLLKDVFYASLLGIIGGFFLILWFKLAWRLSYGKKYR